MGDHAAQPPPARMLDARASASESGPGAGSSRIQRPAAAAATGAKLGVIEVRRRRLADLGAGPIWTPMPALSSASLQVGDAAGDLGGHDVVVGAYMRCRADRPDSVGLGLPRHVEAVLEVDRAVVERGEDVAVQVDAHRRA